MKSMWRLTGLVLIGAAVFLAGCGGKYADVKKVNAEFVSMLEDYVAELEKADSAKDVAAAMNSYADQLEGIMPEMKKLQEKYPELKDQDNIPAELEESMESAMAAGMNMAGTFMKIAPYMEDPEVQKAQERIGRIMMQE